MTFSFQLWTLVTFLVSISASTVTIDTSLGKVMGNEVRLNGNDVYEFLGLRYSNPMLSNLRFRQAEEYTTPYNGTYDATSYPCGCPQWLTDMEISFISFKNLFWMKNCYFFFFIIFIQT